MTTPAEQLFLFGEVVPDLPSWAVLDLTTTGSMLFAGVCLLSLVVGYFDHLSWVFWLMYSLFSTVASSLTLVPVYALASGARLVLASISSHQELQVALHHLRDRLIIRTMESRLCRWCASALGWLFPADSIIMVCRLLVVALAARTAFPALLVPMVEALAGFAEGFLSGNLELSGFCISVQDWSASQAGLTISQWKQLCYCLGEAAGLEAKAIVEDDWGFDDIYDGEIHHLFALVFVATTLVIATAVVLTREVVVRYANSAVREQRRAEAKLRDELHRQQEADALRTAVHDYQFLLANKSGLVAAKDEELRVAKQKLEMCRAEVKSLKAPRDNAMVFRWRLPDPRVAELQQSLEQKVKSFNAAEEKLRMAQKDANARERSLEFKVATLEQKLAEREQADDKSLSENASLRAALEMQTRKLETTSQLLEANEHRLAAVEERCELSWRQMGIERQKFAAESQRLTSERQLLEAQVNGLTVQVQLEQEKFQQATADYRSLQISYDELMGQVFENSDRDQENAELRRELEATREAAEARITELQGLVYLANQSAKSSRQTMHDFKLACDTVRAQDSKEHAATLLLVERLQSGVSDLERRLGKTLRDASESRKQAEEFRELARAAELRLAKYEPLQGSSSQGIPTYRSGRSAWVSNALEESRVTVALQSAEIEQLKSKLEAAKQGVPSPSEEATHQIARLRSDLEGERRARTEDQIRWDRRTRELEEENRRLRISRSNDAGVFNRRASRR